MSSTSRCNIVADELLANGVFVPPCKVGDTIYMPWEYKGIECVALLTATHIIIDREDSYIKTDFDTDDNDYWELCNGGKFYFGELNKRFFLTKEEAEHELKRI